MRYVTGPVNLTHTEPVPHGSNRMRRVGSDRVKRCSKSHESARIGSASFKSRGSSRVGSKAFQSSRVGSSRLKRFSKSRGSGRVGSDQETRPDPIRLVGFDLTLEKPGLYRYSCSVFRIIFSCHLDRERFLHVFSVEESVLLSGRGDLGEIESGKTELRFEILHTHCSMNVQCCVRVSASHFQVVTRKSGGVTRAFGNIVRFLAGPARMVWSYCIYL